MYINEQDLFGCRKAQEFFTKREVKGLGLFKSIRSNLSRYFFDPKVEDYPLLLSINAKTNRFLLYGF